MMLEQGVHKGIAPADYHAWEFNPSEPKSGPISCSLFKRFLSEGPESLLTKKVYSSSSLAWGSLVDCLLFTPNHFDSEFVSKALCNDLAKDGSFRSNAAKAWKAEQESLGKTIITNDQQNDSLEAVARLKNTPAASEILSGADYQVGLVYRPDHGVPYKALLDVLPHHLDHDDCIADLKTTAANIHDDGELNRAIYKWGYHIQAALYLYIWNKLNDDRRNRWKIIWQSSKAPFEVRVTELLPEWIEIGRHVISKRMPEFLECIQSNRFESPFLTCETVLAPPGYAQIYDEDEAA